MATRRPFLALMLFVLLPATAWADRHKWDAAVAGTASNGGSILWGEHVSAGFVLPKARSFSLVADFSHQSETGLERNTFLTGLRYTPLYIEDPTQEHKEGHHTSPFVHVLLGEVRTTREDPKRIDFAAAVGVGMDALLVGGFGARAQADLIRVWSQGRADTFFRVSVGVVFRLERDHD